MIGTLADDHLADIPGWLRTAVLGTPRSALIDRVPPSWLAAIEEGSHASLFAPMAKDLPKFARRMTTSIDGFGIGLFEGVPLLTMYSGTWIERRYGVALQGPGCVLAGPPATQKQIRDFQRKSGPLSPQVVALWSAFGFIDLHGGPRTATLVPEQTRFTELVELYPTSYGSDTSGQGPFYSCVKLVVESGQMVKCAVKPSRDRVWPDWCTTLFRHGGYLSVGRSGLDHVLWNVSFDDDDE